MLRVRYSMRIPLGAKYSPMPWLARLPGREPCQVE